MLARADANVAHLKMEPTDLYQILHTAGQKAKVLASGKGLTFSDAVLPHSHVLLANQAALERLFMCVMDNAVKYTPPGGHVTLVLSLEDSQAIIEVRDTGIGIAQQDLPHVFERFYRADQARSRETRGSGLGLSIAKWITETHNGSIDLRSQPGQGTTVSIRLPLTNEIRNNAFDPRDLREIPLETA
jgi:signal transduction histidine kinase